jgi:hypothetical protein
MADVTKAGSVMGASATKNAPSSNSSSSSAAICKPRRVLPMPPGPVRVSKRTSSPRRRSRTSLSSRSRPTSGVGWAGRLFILASRVFRGGKLEGNPGVTAWKTRSGRKRSLRRRSPRSLSFVPSGSVSRTNSWVAEDSNTWPP